MGQFDFTFNGVSILNLFENKYFAGTLCVSINFIQDEYLIDRKM